MSVRVFLEEISIWFSLTSDQLVRHHPTHWRGGRSDRTKRWKKGNVLSLFLSSDVHLSLPWDTRESGPQALNSQISTSAPLPPSSQALTLEDWTNATTFLGLQLAGGRSRDILAHITLGANSHNKSPLISSAWDRCRNIHRSYWLCFSGVPWYFPN